MSPKDGPTDRPSDSSAGLPSDRAEDRATAQQKQVWDQAASKYDRMIALFERSMLTGGREWIAERARGRVLEVAMGTGRNLPFYGQLELLAGVDLSREMLAGAVERATEAEFEVSLMVGNAEALPIQDASVDTVVCALALCSIPRPEQAIAEMHRVLAPGGRLLLIDHVASSSGVLRLAQRAVEAVTVRAAGEYFTRRPLPLVREAGFRVVETVNRKAGIIEFVHAEKPTS